MWEPSLDFSNKVSNTKKHCDSASIASNGPGLTFTELCQKSIQFICQVQLQGLLRQPIPLVNFVHITLVLFVQVNTFL